MKYHKIGIIIIVLISICGFFILILSEKQISYSASKKNEIINNNNDGSKLKDSESGIIHIIGNDGWLDFKNSGSCTGEGTSSEPYLIENRNINGGGTYNCILIEDSDVFFRIEKCTITNSGDFNHQPPNEIYAGIKLKYAKNGQLVENDCKQNQGRGIYLENSEKIFILDNDLSDNMVGVTLVGSKNNSIIDNEILLNSNNGVVLYDNSNGNIISNNNIRNTGSHYGLSITNCRNNQILNNDISNNGDEGVHLREYYAQNDYNIISGNTINYNGGFGIGPTQGDPSGDHNTFKNNIIKHNDDGGIYLTGQYNTITENVVNNNGYGNSATQDGGILMLSGSHNTLTKNTLINNEYYGMLIVNDYCIITENSISHHKIGIDMWVVGSTISYNFVTENEIGIRVGGDRSTILENDIIDNTDYGVIISSSGSTNHLIYRNYFENPSGINAFDDGVNNLWDNGHIGNYWHDYNGEDNNNDGIGDTAYTDIVGSVGSQDNYPLLDITPPSINIILPHSYHICGVKAPNFTVEINDERLDEMWYTIGLDPTKYFFFDNESIDPNAWNGLEGGLHVITFHADDSVENYDSADINIIKDTEAPNIEIFTPSDGQIFNNTAPKFEIEISDLSLNTSWYSLNGGVNFTFQNNVTFDSNEWSDLPNGTVLITFYANDTFSNISSQTINIFKDKFEPEIVIIEPINESIFGLNSPKFNITITEGNLNKTWYTINGETEIFFFKDVNGTINQDAWNLLEDGNIIIRFWANDSVGNIGYNETSIIKSVPKHSIGEDNGSSGGGGGDGESEPNLIPYGNYYLIFIIIGIISIIVLTKSKKKLKLII